MRLIAIMFKSFTRSVKTVYFQRSLGNRWIKKFYESAVIYFLNLQGFIAQANTKQKLNQRSSLRSHLRMCVDASHRYKIGSNSGVFDSKQQIQLFKKRFETCPRTTPTLKVISQLLADLDRALVLRRHVIIHRISVLRDC